MINNIIYPTVKYRLSAARDKIKEAVLIYEKENKDRLHAIVPIPILMLILRSKAEHTVVPDIRLFKNSTASAKHLKAERKATMKNALTGKVIAAAAVVVVVGGEITVEIARNRNNDSNIIDNDSYINELDSDSDNALSMATDTNDSKTGSNVDASTAANIENSEQEDEGKFFDWRRINMYIPPNYESANVYCVRAGRIAYYNI